MVVKRTKRRIARERPRATNHNNWPMASLKQLLRRARSERERRSGFMVLELVLFAKGDHYVQGFKAGELVIRWPVKTCAGIAKGKMLEEKLEVLKAGVFKNRGFINFKPKIIYCVFNSTADKDISAFDDSPFCLLINIMEELIMRVHCERLSSLVNNFK